MGSFWHFARQMLRDRLLVGLALLFATLSAAGLGAGLLGIAPILDQILGRGRDLPQLAADFNADGPLAGRIPQGLIDALPPGEFVAAIWIVAALAVLTVIGGTCNFLHVYCAQTVVQRTIARVRQKAFDRVIHMPLRAVVAGGSSEPISRVINDPQTLGMGLSALLSKVVAQVTKGAAALVVAFIIDWRLTLVSLLVAPVLYTVIRKLGKRIRRSSRAALRSQAGLYAAATEAVQGLRVVKVHTTEPYESERFGRINERVLSELLRVRTARALASPLVEVLSIFVLGGLCLVAIRAIQTGDLDPTRFILALGALAVAGSSLKPLTGLMNDIQQSTGAADRLAELLAGEEEPGHEPGLPELPRHERSIEFGGVTFTYPGAQDPALSDVTLSVERGETVAVVGPNGSGKTTLLALVPRLFDPDEGAGRVLIDGTDIRNVSVESLRRQIGVVTQETVLFHATIAENIAYGASGATRERIVEAAERARARAFIEAMPEGFDAVVGERGLTLSGGQRQRIAIARAILRDPAILILDEATSMIDAESEAQIGAAIAEFSEGRTCLVVAHRLSTVLGADRIVVMDGGRIVDRGRHDELLDRCGVYRQIARHQLVPTHTK